MLFARPGQTNSVDTVSVGKKDPAPSVSDQSNGHSVAFNSIVKEDPTHFSVSFSSIHKVDGWSREQLKKIGISVNSWKHASQKQDPPQDWFQISFDRSIPKSQDCLMTVQFIHDNGVIESASRAEWDGSEKDALRLIFMVNDRYRDTFDDSNVRSNVTIVMWKDSPNGGRSASGYRLSVKRIIELAGK